MSYFSLPNINQPLDVNEISIENSFSTELDVDMNVAISHSLCKYLRNLKLNIDNVLLEWDIYKKYTNQYEYIHSVVSGTKQSVSKLTPISRSFYKLVEIYNIMGLDDCLPKNINTFHLAEGPGGFIEAMLFLRNNLNDTYYGMTLVSPDPSVPGWKKNLNLENYSNVHLEKGADGTGNLFNTNNLFYCKDKYGPNMDLITADGGFDYSVDFNKQESLSVKLIISQISFAISMQKPGGTFILKIFDIFTQSTLDILYLLSSLYASVDIIKPNTSRSANSEKYVICKGFKEIDVNLILSCITPMINEVNNNVKIKRILNVKLPCLFLNKIAECNIVFGQQQMENISTTLNLIKTKRHEKIENLKKNNIQKCLLWCQKNGVPYNKTIQNTNIFLSSLNTR